MIKPARRDSTTEQYCRHDRSRLLARHVNRLTEGARASCSVIWCRDPHHHARIRSGSICCLRRGLLQVMTCAVSADCSVSSWRRCPERASLGASGIGACEGLRESLRRGVCDDTLRSPICLRGLAQSQCLRATARRDQRRICAQHCRPTDDLASMLNIVLLTTAISQMLRREYWFGAQLRRLIISRRGE